MEKYGVAQPDLIAGLRNEEARLMSQAAKFMSGGIKTASDASSLNALENRLAQVRAEITEHDLSRQKDSE